MLKELFLFQRWGIFFKMLKNLKVSEEHYFKERIIFEIYIFFCRKLKNRVAAQTARDRKKAKMDGMEVNLTDLQDENKRLMEENRALRQQSQQLSSENRDLKERLGQATSGVVIKKETELESAALGVSLQKEQIQALFQLMTRYVAFLLTLR